MASADATFPLIFVLQFRRQPKITNFDLHVFAQKDVSKLDIPVYDVILVQINERIADLLPEVFDFDLSEAFAVLEHVLQWGIRA